MDETSGHFHLRHTLTVREVKVMHMPPKPLKVRAMKMRTESSANGINESVNSAVCKRVKGKQERGPGRLTVWLVSSISDEQTGQSKACAEKYTNTSLDKELI